MTPRIASLPQPPDGVRQAVGMKDAVRILWWVQISAWYSVRHGHGLARPRNALEGLMWWPCWPIVVIVQTFNLRRKKSQYYMSVDGDAVLGVLETRRGWRLQDHLSARPGTGAGGRLRSIMGPWLVARADEADAALYMTAADPRLSEAYRAEMDGLMKLGGTGRHKLRRESASSTQ